MKPMENSCGVPGAPNPCAVMLMRDSNMASLPSKPDEVMRSAKRAAAATAQSRSSTRVGRIRARNQVRYEDDKKRASISLENETTGTRRTRRMTLDGSDGSDAVRKLSVVSEPVEGSEPQSRKEPMRDPMREPHERRPVAGVRFRGLPAPGSAVAPCGASGRPLTPAHRTRHRHTSHDTSHAQMQQ